MANGNSVNDEIREQHQKIMEEKGLTGRISYFFYYYKVQTLISLIVVGVLIAIIVSIATRKNTALQVIYINGFPVENAQTFMDDFAATIQIDPKKEEVLFDDSFYIATENPTTFDEDNKEKLFVMSSAARIDVCVADEAFFKEMAQQGYLLDLSTVLSSEQMDKYKDDLFYYDSPENMHEGEEAVGIKVTDANKIVSEGSFPNTDCYYCIIMNSKHVDNALAFLDYLEQ